MKLNLSKQEERIELSKMTESAAAIKLAAKIGGYIVYPQPNELLIDLDGEESVKTFERCFPIFQREIDATAYIVRQTPSKTQGNQHVVVSLREPLTTERRVLYQAVLGSDPLRELLSFSRILKNDPTPTLLVETPATFERRKKV